MEAVLTIVICAVSLFALIEDDEEEQAYKKYAFWGIGFLLVIIAAARETGFDHDSLNYEYLFQNSGSWNVGLVVEFSYILICNILKFFWNDVHGVFFVYACIGVLVKFKAIRSLSPIYFLPIVVYLGNFFMLHEMTQIRAGVASAFFLLSLKPLSDGRRWQAFACIVVAIFFHYSAAMLLPVLLFGNKELSDRGRLFLALLIPLGFVFYFVNYTVSVSIPIPFIGDKLNTYQTLRDKGIMGNQGINPFSLIYLAQMAIYLYCIYFYHTIRHFNKYITILLKVKAISIMALFLFSDFHVMASRVNELFGVVDIILYPCIYFTVRQKYIGRLVVIVIGLSLYAIGILQTGLFDSSKAL